MKKKNLLSLLLAFALMLGMMAACGSAPANESGAASAQSAAEPEATGGGNEELFVPEVNTPAPAASNEEGESAEDAEPAGPSYTIPISEEPLTYSAWMTYAPFAAELNVNTETLEGLLVLDKLQEVTNVHFDIVAANGAAEQDNFNLMIAGGDYCDILSSMNFYSTGLEGAVEEGIIQDLSDVVPEKCPLYWSKITSNTDTLMQAYTDSGYLPTLVVVTPEVGQEVIGNVIRKDWLDEFGMEMPKTFDDLYDYLDKSYQEKGAIFEVTNSDGMVGDLAAGLNISLGGFEVVDSQVEYGAAQDAFKDYLKFMNRLYNDKLISQDFFSTTNEDRSSRARLDFGLGTNSLLAVSAANTSDVVMNAANTEGFEMAVMPYVSVDGNSGNHIGPDTLMGTMKDNDAWSFSAECENIDPLLEMVEFLYSDEGYLLANYGVEGETYTMVDGEPQYTDLVINNPDGLSYFFASYIYATNAASGFFPYVNDLSKSFYDFNDNQWQVFEDLKNLSDCEYNYPSYAKMSTEETTTYAGIESDLSTYMDSTVLEFIVGTRDIDEEFDSFVDTLYDMGLQDMIDLKQAAYDRAVARMEAFTARSTE